MPIPESEAFLKRKPTVPPSFQGITYEDDEGIKKAQDAIIREQWVKLMMARLVREEMGKCYRREGVNHLQNCGHLRERYFELMNHCKIKGHLWEMKHLPPEGYKYPGDPN
ncbi:hypothetical protein HDK77DRAFT_433435 [Phyllosticta capitalensis]